MAAPPATERTSHHSRRSGTPCGSETAARTKTCLLSSTHFILIIPSDFDVNNDVVNFVLLAMNISMQGLLMSVSRRGGVYGHFFAWTFCTLKENLKRWLLE